MHEVASAKNKEILVLPKPIKSHQQTVDHSHGIPRLVSGEVSFPSTDQALNLVDQEENEGIRLSLQVGLNVLKETRNDTAALTKELAEDRMGIDLDEFSPCEL